MVAEKLDCRVIDITNMMHKESPTEALLLHAMRHDVKLGYFLSILKDLERFDVIEELRPMIGLFKADVAKYNVVG